jgi:hypothetical protein
MYEFAVALSFSHSIPRFSNIKQNAPVPKELGCPSKRNDE